MSLDEWSARRSTGAENRRAARMRREGMHSRRQIVWYRSPIRHSTVRPVSTEYRKRPISAATFPPICRNSDFVYRSVRARANTERRTRITFCEKKKEEKSRQTITYKYKLDKNNIVYALRFYVYVFLSIDLQIFNRIYRTKKMHETDRYTYKIK